MSVSQVNGAYLDFDVRSQSSSVDNYSLYSDSLYGDNLYSDSLYGGSDKECQQECCSDDIRTQCSSIYDSDSDSDSDSYLQDEENGFCVFCFYNENGICRNCSSRMKVCMNCVVYGIDGNPCQNCESMGDEGIDLTFDLVSVLDYINRNRQYFIRKTQCEVCGDYLEDFTYGRVCAKHIPSYALY